MEKEKKKKVGLLVGVTAVALGVVGLLGKKKNREKVKEKWATITKKEDTK